MKYVHDKLKKLIRESYFFKTVLHVYYKQHFHEYYRLRFDSNNNDLNDI